MMKNILTTLFLIAILIGFTLFININNKFCTVRSVITPTKIEVDTNQKRTNSTTIFCIENINSFSLGNEEDFISKYQKQYNLTPSEIISMGYLAQDYSQKLLLNKKVKIIERNNALNDCKFAKILIDGTDYGNILANSGFGIRDNKIANIDKFKHNLEIAKKLHLVILNHHSNKYHTLTCPYGKIAHDSVILPQSQIPKDAKPCKYCHNKQTKPTTHLKTRTDIIEIPQIIQPKLQASSGNITTYITDFTKVLKPTNKCSTNACVRLINEIDKATSSIDMALYGYRDVQGITNALTRAKNRGVRIRYIYDTYFNSNKEYYKDNSIITNISQTYRTDKTNSKSQTNMLMHNKFIIFDNKTVYTGSMNLSPTGTSGFDVNSIVVISSQDIANLYTKEFEQMLSGKFHIDKIKTDINNKFMINNSEIEIYFSPQDNPSTKIVRHIKNAKKYIYIPTFLITHNEISNELINAHNRGVDVRVIIDANSVNSKNSKHAKLRQAGIMLKTENYAGKLHAKTIIIDDLYLITGSMNFTNSGGNKNDENILIIKNDNIAKLHKNFFLYLWTIIPNKYLHKNAKPESPDSIGSCTDGVDNNFNNKIDSEETACKF